MRLTKCKGDIISKCAINKTMKYFIRFILVVVGIMISSTIWAQESADYADRAKNRTYPGGIEESDLKILPASHFQNNKNRKSEDINEGF